MFSTSTYLHRRIQEAAVSKVHDDGRLADLGVLVMETAAISPVAAGLSLQGLEKNKS